MKRIIPWIIIFLLWISCIYFWIIWMKKINIVDNFSYIHLEKAENNTVIINSKYVDFFQQDLLKKYNNHWIEIQNYFVENKKIRFAHIFHWKTFVCRNWKLIIQYNWEEKEIFSYDNEKSDFWPCSFNVSQTKDKNIFLVDFCLSWLGSSWECFGTDMYYNVKEYTWKKWDLFFIWYENEQRVKTPLSQTNVDMEAYKKIYEEFLEYMDKNNFTYTYFQ